MAHVATGDSPVVTSLLADKISVTPSGLVSLREGNPRLAPWAAFLRRFAAWCRPPLATMMKPPRRVAWAHAGFTKKQESRAGWPGSSV